jgi:hypothetical protein
MLDWLDSVAYSHREHSVAQRYLSRREASHQFTYPEWTHSIKGQLSYQRFPDAEARSSPLTVADITVRGVHSQEQSPLFSKLPPELRRPVFDYVLQETKGSPVYGDFQLYILGLGYYPRFCTQLLRTCKRVYFEARELFIINMTQTYLFYDGSHEPGGLSRSIYKHPINMLRKSIQLTFHRSQIYHSLQTISGTQ